MEVPSRETLARMPLAEAVLTLWRWVADETYLNQLFEKNRGRCYEKVLSFSFIVYVIRDALLEFNGSGNKALKHARDSNELGTSIAAAYGKLGRLPIPVSMAFLAGCTARLREVYPEAEVAQTPVPESLKDYHVIPLDGKAIKRVAKRLKPLRGVAGGLLGGRALVAMELSTGLALAMHADPDGDANDTKFVKDLVPPLRELVSGPRLWLCDSGFCDLTQPIHFSADPDDAFLFRYHPKVPFDRDPERPTRKGRDRNNRRYREDWGWLGSPKNKKRRYVRRITLIRPGEPDVILVTNLCDAEEVPAEDLLEVYLKRWGIERMFQQVTEVFGLSHLIGTTPEGTIFQFAMCLLLYNLIQVVRGVIAVGAERPREEISSENLFDDVKRELIAWNVVIDPEATISHFEGEWTALRVKARLSELLSGQWQSRWLKAKPKKKTPPPPKEHERAHDSVFRILQAHQEKLRKERSAAKRAQRC
jgi:DDE family transposase